MPCYHPLTGYRAKAPNPSGKYSLVFNRSQGYVDQPITVPCGGCIGCRLEYSRQWAVRCMHEAQLWENNVFLTLTYRNEDLPKDNSLVKSDFQKFMKRLRKNNQGIEEDSNGKRPIRFFHCGEYGENFGRPHYHALIFNFDFSNKYFWRLSPCKNYKIYRSESLEKLWPYGFAEIGSVTYQSAAYVARYVVKKVKGEAALDHYNEYNQDTGEITSERTPEYVTMSRRPGIGQGWIEKYKTDVYPNDICVVDGQEWKPPRYYDNQLDELELAKIKGRRKAHAKTDSVVYNSTIPRRLTREKVKQTQLNRLKRDIT